MINLARISPTPLDIGQRAAIAGTRLFFGTVTGALRLVRGSPPHGWTTVRYGLHRDEILDIRTVAGEKAHRHPVVFIHGGGWMMGTKDFYSHDLCFLGEAGFPVFNVEYPKAPEHPHPWMLRSILKALAFARVSPEGAKAVHVMGDSAGGNLAAMAAVLACNPALIIAVDPSFDPSRLPAILSVTSIYGVLERGTCLNSRIPAGRTMIQSYGGEAACAEAVDAAHAITPMDVSFRKHPPCFLGCGDKDPILPSTMIYSERLRAEGHDVSVKIYPGATHGYFNFPEGKVKSESQADLVAFLNRIEEM
jgi:acetyl esterase/lipase